MLRRFGLPLLLMSLGSLSMIGGLGLLISHISHPTRHIQLLPLTPSPLPPTPAFWLLTPIAPPPPPSNQATAIPIMPVMAVLDEPSATPSGLNPPNLNPTPSPSPIASETPLAQIQTQIENSPAASPTATPQAPTRLSIPSIGLDAPIESVGLTEITLEGALYYQWRVPDAPIVGWHESSAALGQRGNLVLNGHHNVYGGVLRDLINVGAGAMLYLAGADGQSFSYTVVQTMLLQEEGVSSAQRLENARWLLPSPDERITLVTCWPPNGRSHRLVVIALPN